MLAGRVAEDRSWLSVMAALAAIELGWWFITWRKGIAPSPFIATYTLLAIGGLLTAVALRLVFGSRPAGASWMVIMLGTVLVAVGASTFLPLKYAIPSEIPFWLDRPLATAERAFFGDDPWLVLDHLIGWATLPLDRIYACWLPTQLIVMFLVMLSRPSPSKSQSLIAYSLAWFVLGVVAAVLLSSRGPLFYDRAFGGQSFAPLAATLHRRGAWAAITESDRMWASFATGRPGFVAGISAMPSIHVAISLWIVFTSQRMAPRAFWVSVVYFMLISLGSVQLGWHYVADGIVAAIGMIAIWRFAPLLDRKQADWNEPVSGQSLRKG